MVWYGMVWYGIEKNICRSRSALKNRPDFSEIFFSCFILFWSKEAAVVHFTWMLKQLKHTSEYCNTLFT